MIQVHLFYGTDLPLVFVIHRLVPPAVESGRGRKGQRITRFSPAETRGSSR